LAILCLCCLFEAFDDPFSLLFFSLSDELLSLSLLEFELTLWWLLLVLILFFSSFISFLLFVFSFFLIFLSLCFSLDLLKVLFSSSLEYISFLFSDLLSFVSVEALFFDFLFSLSLVLSSSFFFLNSF